MLKTSIHFLVICVSIATISGARAEITAEELVAKTLPSIVSITVAPSSAFLPDTVIKDVPTPVPTLNLKGYSVGSGTIISSDGYILTADSILNSSGDITVTLDDGSKNLAKIVGKDTKTGFALIKIQKTNLPFINILYPNQLALGQNLISVGRTSLGSISMPVVTNGIISGIAVGSDRDSAIQSTISVQPGMGGAPVLSLKTGEIIGIVQTIYRSQQYASMTFSTPIEEYLKVENSLKANSKK